MHRLLYTLYVATVVIIQMEEAWRHMAGKSPYEYGRKIMPDGARGEVTYLCINVQCI
jgi:hypothetical protein